MALRVDSEAPRHSKPRRWSESPYNSTTGQTLRLHLRFGVMSVPPNSLYYPFLLGRDSYMRFTNRIKLLTRQIDNNRVFGEYTFNYHDPRGAEAYIRDPTTPGGQFQPRYARKTGVPLSDAHQMLEVNLVRANGVPALRGQYLVDMDPNMLPSEEVFVSQGRISSLLRDIHAEIEPAMVLGSAFVEKAVYLLDY